MQKIHSKLFVLLLGCGAAMATAAAPLKSTVKPEFPAVSMKSHSRGDAAIKALGANLPNVAAWYGKSSKEFTRLIRQDKSLRLDQHGRVHFVDEGMVPPPPQDEGMEVQDLEEAPVIDWAAAAGSAPFPLEQTLQLHSRPGAKRTIYLDFDGEWVMGKGWNYSYGKQSIVAQPYDTDGNPWVFSDAELLALQQIWQRVSEDYAAFEVDVTTELPPEDMLTRTSTEDQTYGMRVIITKDWTENTAQPCNCGGLAYVATFNEANEYFKTAWVFYNRLDSGNEKYVAEAASHETGHTLGLYHDGHNNGITSSSYYSGHGSGQTSWAPIMGAGYYMEVTQWSKGEYPGADNTEDDIGVIEWHGLPHRDIGQDSDSTLSAPEIAGKTVVSGQGVISSVFDMDMFEFSVGHGDIQITASPAERGGNLDLKLELYGPDWSLLATSTPTYDPTATVTYPGATSGQYHLRVSGAGNADLATGYSNYGSLGQYTISGTGATVMNPMAQIKASKLSGIAPLPILFDGISSDMPLSGGALTYLWNFGDGTGATGAKVNHTYKTAGVYVATLTVTNAAGYSDQASVTVQVFTTSYVLHVSNITMMIGQTTTKKGIKSSGFATVTVVDANGIPVSGVTVKVQWSGVTNKSSSKITDQNGQALVPSPVVITPTGEFRATVSKLTRRKFQYNPSANVITTNSMSY